MQSKKKKILFAAYSLDLGGIETALISLINYLASKYDITLVLEKKQGIFLNQVNENVEIIEYKPSYIKIQLVSKIINLCKRIKFSIKYKNKFDFACSYATYCKMNSVVTRIASKNNALWVHNNYYDFFDKNDYKYRKFFDSINSHKFRNIFFVSEETKKQYEKKYGIKHEKTISCNNLIDYEKILKLSQEDISIKKDNNVTTFINISRHDEHQKKITRLIECAKLLANDGKMFRVLLVGEGKETEKYKRIVEDYNLSEKIIFIGKTANPYSYLKMSDCVVLTSDYEGYPVTYIEAKIMGKPIITTDVSDSMVDIEKKFGIVTEKNTADIYKAMKHFLDYGFVIKERFDPELYNKEIKEKVEDIINERN